MLKSRSFSTNNRLYTKDEEKGKGKMPADYVSEESSSKNPNGTPPEAYGDVNQENYERAVRNSLQDTQQTNQEAGPSNTQNQNPYVNIHNVSGELGPSTPDNPERGVRNSVGGGTFDSILTMAPTPPTPNSSEGDSDSGGTHPHFIGMEIESIKASKVWNNTEKTEAGTANARMILDYYVPNQQARLKKIEELLLEAENGWTDMSKFKIAYLRGRGMAISTYLEEAENLRTDTNAQIDEERHAVDEGLGGEDGVSPPPADSSSSDSSESTTVEETVEENNEEEQVSTGKRKRSEDLTEDSTNNKRKKGDSDDGDNDGGSSLLPTNNPESSNDAQDSDPNNYRTLLLFFISQFFGLISDILNHTSFFI